MKIDFKNAAKRHFNDGELLYQHTRWANADNLYGLSAECILKSIIAGLNPHEIDAITGDSIDRRSPHKKHLGNSSKNLWEHFSTHFAGRLAANSPLSATNPFTDWDIAQRYAHEQYFNEQNVTHHRLATINLQNLLDNLFASGALA